MTISARTAEAASSPLGDDLWQQAERLVFASLHRAECHVTAARFFSNVHFLVGTLAAGLAVAAGGTAFVSRDWVTGLLAILAAAATGLLTSLRPDERSQLHWKAAATYWALADDVYMTFSFGVTKLPTAPDSGGSGGESWQSGEAERAPDETAKAPDATGSLPGSPLQLLRGFQTDYHRLETVGPPVPLRLARKAERWIANNEEWFPPQYTKFNEWRGEREKPRARKGLIRRFAGAVARLW